MAGPPGGQAARTGAQLCGSSPRPWAVIVLAAIAGAVMTILAWGDLKAGDRWNLGPRVAAAGLRHARWTDCPPGGQRHRLDHARRGRRTGVSRAGFHLRGDRDHDLSRALPAAKQMGLLAEWSFVAATFTTGFMLLLFPTGTLLSRRWLPVAAPASAGRPDADRVGRDAEAAAASGAGRYIAGVPEPAGRQKLRPVL